MGFNEIMMEMVESVEGGVAGTVMATDGIPLGQYIKPGNQCAMDVMGVEYSNVLMEIKKAAEVLELGEVEEITIASHGTNVAIRLLSHEYFVAFILSNKTIIGKARFKLRLATQKSLVELG